jgi:mannose-6-phosphate isomerase class I
LYFKDRKSNYDKSPVVEVRGYEDSAWQGYQDIVSQISKQWRSSNKRKIILTIDFYHGVRHQEVLNNLISKLKSTQIYNAEEAMLPEEVLYPKLMQNITDDRVFGVLSIHKINDFFDIEKLQRMRDAVNGITEGLVIVYGVGASLVNKGDILVYADLARWEIQLRLRSKELDNWGVGNYEEDMLRKYKRAYFIEWRVLDRHKRAMFGHIDYLLDTHIKDDPKLITVDVFRGGLEQASQQPFRLVPYFDEGVWGGQWMEEVCGLQRKNNNYAWGFDGVPEENSLMLKVGDITVEIPAIDLVFDKPNEFLGAKVHSRFGFEFPIRFDFLDTMGGGSLSLQVHPLTAYIQENFGMHYTQDESYYMLDAGEDACVYLGVKDDVTGEELIPALLEAQNKGETFDDSKYINKFPVKKHDHVLIPAGTIHCSGKNSMVLEISATPYIFTFKLWDWDRVGLDGIPRPVHIEHGKMNIQYDRKTEWVTANLMNRVELIAEGDGWKEERTGLHELEFIETRRHWFSKAVTHHTNGIFQVMNLIEGEEAVVESPAKAFEPFVVHYAETFFIPAAVGEYVIRPFGKSIGNTIGTIKAYVRI